MSGPRLLASGLALSGLALALACGGGGGSSVAPPPFTVSAASLTLPVPPVANQPTTQSVNSYYPPPYVGTVTLTLNRTANFTGAVTLSINASNLPAGVKADFANATIPSGGTSAVLSIQAGYPNPADDTDTEQIYPNQGSYSIPISATSGTTTETGTLTLNLVTEPANFVLTLIDPTTGYGEALTNIDLSPGTTTIENFNALWNTGTYTTFGPVTMALTGVPEGLAVSYDNTEVTLVDENPHTLSITPSPNLAPGVYSFKLSASYLGQTQTLPLLVTYAPAPFSLRTPNSSTVYVAQGQALTLPAYLWHDDNYFGTSEPDPGTDPSYVGSTSLSVTGVTASTPQVSFAATGLDGLASAPLTVAAGSAAPGNYPVQLVATRNGASTSSNSLPMTVTVTSASAAPTVWIQNVEWGQSVLAPNLRLVAGKPALLRVQLLADRPGVTAPTVTATINNSANGSSQVTLAGPATVPMTITEGDLPNGSTPSGSTYTAILPAADIQPGMTVAIQAGTVTQTLTPSVDPGYDMNLTIVPVNVSGVAPVIPASSVMTSELASFWPVKSINLTQRAPYTTATTVPVPTGDALTDTSGDAWFELLNELAALRIVDGASGNYYGMFNPSLPSNFTETIVGLSLLGEGIGIGIDDDSTTANLLLNNDSPLDLATTVMVHEQGHAFNLNHAPGGGAATPQLDYPYVNTYQGTVGGAIGSWGFDPATQTSHDPTKDFDIMSYVQTSHWVSDWNYINAMGFMDENEATPVSLVAAQDQYVVSGWIGPDQQAHLAPLVRANCPAHPPKPGNLSLVLTTASGKQSIAFGTTEVPDLPAGHQHFSFTVPAGAELLSAEVQVPGARPLATLASVAHPARIQSSRSLAYRAQAVGAAAVDGSLVIKEQSGRLHLEWDAQVHPYVDVVHEGAARTTLGLHLRGGVADLNLAGLPEGGRFLIHYSDGLNAVAHVVAR